MLRSCFSYIKIKNQYIFILIICVLFFISNITKVYAGSYERKNAVVKAVSVVSPAVVNVSSAYPVHRRSNPFSSFGDPFFDSFFKDFFDPVPGKQYPGKQYNRTSLGSGVIIDGTEGFILTNAHVIDKTGTITVTLKDEREFKASIVGADPDSDLAVLKISSKDILPDIKMGDSKDLMIGEDVIAIGNPFGFSHTVTTGVISALNRSIRTENTVYHDFIQTDASINPGNSGGPLLNINGELIGINTAVYAKAQGIGFAIPINKAKRIISELIRYGEVSQIWIGIVVQNFDARMARYFNLKTGAGVLIRKVEAGSPAQKAGIQEGDILLSLGGQDISSADDYYMAVKGFAPDDSIKLTLWREGKIKKISLKSQVFPVEKAMEFGFIHLGVKVKNISSGKGVVITKVLPGSYLSEIGVRPGDILRQIDEILINNTKDYEKAVIRYRNKSSVVLLVQRGDQGYYITLRL